MSEILTSVGTAGEVDLCRSEGRAYLTLDNVVCDSLELLQRFEDLSVVANQNGRRRWVLRALCTNSVGDDLIGRSLSTVESMIPLSLIDPQRSEYVVYLRENIHVSPTDTNYDGLMSYWNKKTEGSLVSGLSPCERVSCLNSRYRLSNQVTKSDQTSLYQLWRPFGWKKSGIDSFITNQSGIWFSGIREIKTGELVSAAMGESLTFAGLQMVEGTEYSTLPGYEGMGLCTAAIIGLHAQILQDTLYANGEIPMIVSEFDVASRSDRVGSKAGIVVPLVPGVPQLLRKNVSVLDRQPSNSIRWRDLGHLRHQFQDAYKTPHRYWRDFVPGVVSYESIQNFYTQNQVESILNQYQEAS